MVSPKASTSSSIPLPLVEEYLEIPCRDTFLPANLCRADPARRSKGIALILHGQMAHRNQTYHKPLVRALAQKRHLDSLRFDFVHAKYNKPGWQWHMARIQRDVDELATVVEYLEHEFGYKVSLLIGHSKGALASFMYLSQTSKPLPLYVNLSGRYDMKRAKVIFGKSYYPAFERQGYYEWKVRAAGQDVQVRITPDQFDEFVNHDTSFIETSFPKSTHVLTIHGDADKVVPVDDGYTHHRILSQRLGPGTSTLLILPGADHNYIKRYDDVIDGIIDWLVKVEGTVDLPKGHL